MKPYDMPQPTLGEIVLFAPHEGADLSPVIVTKVGTRTIEAYSLIGGMVKPSIHHKDDPGLEEFPDWKTYGTWVPRPRDPAIAILSEKVATLEKKSGKG